jgi:hypothetical protein
MCHDGNQAGNSRGWHRKSTWAESFKRDDYTIKRASRVRGKVHLEGGRHNPPRRVSRADLLPIPWCMQEDDFPWSPRTTLYEADVIAVWYGIDGQAERFRLMVDVEAGELNDSRSRSLVTGSSPSASGAYSEGGPSGHDAGPSSQYPSSRSPSSGATSTGTVQGTGFPPSRNRYAAEHSHGGKAEVHMELEDGGGPVVKTDQQPTPSTDTMADAANGVPNKHKSSETTPTRPVDSLGGTDVVVPPVRSGLEGSVGPDPGDESISSGKFGARGAVSVSQTNVFAPLTPLSNAMIRSSVVRPKIPQPALTEGSAMSLVIQDSNTEDPYETQSQPLSQVLMSTEANGSGHSAPTSVLAQADQQSQQPLSTEGGGPSSLELDNISLLIEMLRAGGEADAQED